MDPKREAQLKSSAEALAVLTFNFIQAVKRAAEDFQSGVEEIEKGNGSLPVQLPVLNLASENVIDDKRTKKSSSERKVRPAVGPMLGTPNKSNGGPTPVCEEKKGVQQTEEEKQKVVKDVGICGEPDGKAEKEATTPEHSTHSTPAERTVSVTFGALLSNGKDDNGEAEGDIAMAKEKGGPSEDSNALQDDAPSAKRVCI